MFCDDEVYQESEHTFGSFEEQLKSHYLSH